MKEWEKGAFFFVLSAVAAVWTGCSDVASAPPPGGSFDATAEMTPDVDAPATPDGSLPDCSNPAVAIDAPLGEAGDGSTCSMASVWSSDSATLRLTISAGMRPCPVPLYYEFSPATQMLLRIGCFDVAQVIRLSDAENDRLWAEVSALRTTCEEDCLDSTRVQLAIADAGGCVQRVFDGHNQAVCHDSFALPPYIEHGALDFLAAQFRATADAVCNADAGASNLGTCVTSDGGSGRVCPTIPPAPDGAPDADGDAADCHPRPVWSEASDNFTLRRSGGLPPCSPSTGCGTAPEFYDFSSRTKTLIQAGCISGRDGRRELLLSDDQVTAIVAAVKAMPTTCQTSCGAFAPDMTLVPRDCTGRPEASFQSNFYAGCIPSNIAPPYVAFQDLDALMGLMGGMIESSCGDQDAGAGTCNAFCRQAFW